MYGDYPTIPLAIQLDLCPSRMYPDRCWSKDTGLFHKYFRFTVTSWFEVDRIYYRKDMEWSQNSSCYTFKRR